MSEFVSKVEKSARAETSARAQGAAPFPRTTVETESKAKSRIPSVMRLEDTMQLLPNG